MFYVLNQDNQIVAADYDLLEILESNDLQTLFVQVATGELSFEKVNDRKINIQSNNSLITASHEEYVLKTTFGDLTLVKLYNIIVKRGYSTTRDEAPVREVAPEPVRDIRPQRAVSIFADDQDQTIQKPRRASIFIDDEEEIDSTVPKKERVAKIKEVSRISDIVNEKVQSDLMKASQKLKEEKVDKKPTLETLHDEEKEEGEVNSTVTPLRAIVEEAKKEADEDIELDELLIEDEISVAEPISEEPTFSLEEEKSQDEIALEDDLKLAGIDLEEKEEDEASIDELLALADEQESAKEKQMLQSQEEPTFTLDEEEPTEEPQVDFESLALDEEPILALEEEEDTLKLEEPTVALEEEEAVGIANLLLSDEEDNKEEPSIDEGLLLSDEEEVGELSELLLETDDEPIREEVKEEVVEEVEEFDDLLMLDDEPKKETVVEELQIEEEVEEFDDLLMLDDEPRKEVVKEELKVEEEIDDFDDFDDLLMLDDEKPKVEPLKEAPKEDVNEIKDLLFEIEDEPKIESIKEEPKVVKKPVKSYAYPDTIEIDLDEYGEMIGLGAEDYTEFLNEFIDKSIMYDENLRSEDKDVREEALNELSSISQSLQLPHLDEILEDMLDRDYLEEELVDIYFDCLAKVTTKSKPQKVTKSADIFEDESSIEDSKTQKPKVEETSVANPNGYGTLSFEGIKPIHFDFRLEEAAEDLSLPVDLIEEFVNDFIEQAIEEKETFIKAYAQGDMDTIQKTGHKLKGASSNLRIIPLSETLEEIQHCETPARFEPLLKKYWGQFLSFKLFMENISH